LTSKVKPSIGIRKKAMNNRESFIELYDHLMAASEIISNLEYITGIDDTDAENISAIKYVFELRFNKAMQVLESMRVLESMSQFS
jgi:hypothetical protein